MFRLAASPSIRPVREESVSERLRREKELLLGNGQAAPITGQYYDVLRATQQVRTSAPAALTNAMVRGIRNKVGGVRSFAAAGYNYPSGQMVIGASLAGMCGTCGSPALERQRQMAKLMGLGGVPDPELANQIRLAVSLLGIAQAAGLKLPATVEVGDQVCDVMGAIGGAADYIEKNGLDTPVDTAAFSNALDAIQSGDFLRIGAAVGQLSGTLIAITRAVAPVVGACKTKASQSTPPPSAPPVQSGPPRKLSPGEIQNILRRGRGGFNIPRTPPQVRVKDLRPVTPVIPGPTSSSAGNAGIIAAGVAAVGAVAYFLLRKKPAAA